MKNLLKICAVLFVLHIYFILIPVSISAQQSNELTGFQVFYDQLSPYGQWISYPNYDYVWIPNVESYFSPYATEGQWIMTNYGWSWLSDYSWGWAPFHYGRWDYDNYYGWFWVPDTEWGPSWVTWRKASGYYGWAPMRPGMSISMSHKNRYSDAAYWNFVRYNDFDKPNIEQYYFNQNENNRIYNNSSLIRNTFKDNERNSTYISGPRLNQVQRLTDRNINSFDIRENNNPGQILDDNYLQIYRPQVKRRNNSTESSAPAKITDIRDVRPRRERIETDQRDILYPVENNRRDVQSQPNQQIERQREIQQEYPRQQQDMQRQNQQQQVQPRNRTEQQRNDVQQEQPRRQTEIKNQEQPQKREQLSRPAEQPKQKAAEPTENSRRSRQPNETIPPEKK